MLHNVVPVWGRLKQVQQLMDGMKKKWSNIRAYYGICAFKPINKLFILYQHFITPPLQLLYGFTYIKYRHSKTAQQVFDEFGLTHYKTIRKQSICRTTVVTKQPYVQESVEIT